MVNKLKRWADTNKVFLLVVAIVAFFGFIDNMQIKPFHELNSEAAWGLYNTYAGPAWVIMWIVTLLVIAIVYYIMVKDKSEAVGLGAAGIIMLMTGLEDVFFFVFSDAAPTACMQWFNDVGAWNSYWSTYVLQETCVSPFAMYSFAALGVFVAYKVYQKLKVAKW